MAAYLITGSPGAGKTTIIKELQKRGYSAHETDENGLTSWYDLVTGKKPDTTPQNPIDFSRYAWNWDIESIKDMIAEAKGPIFFGGIASNTVSNLDLFDKVFVPHPGLESLKHRIVTRTNNNFGKHPDELADILKDHDGADTWWAKQGAIIIDGDQPADKIVDDILAEIHEHAQKEMV